MFDHAHHRYYYDSDWLLPLRHPTKSKEGYNRFAQITKRIISRTGRGILSISLRKDTLYIIYSSLSSIRFAEGFRHEV